MPKETIHIKVTPEVKAAAEQAAADDKRSLSSFGALAVEEKVERVQKAKAAIYTAEELADQERLGREAGYGR